MSQEVYDKVYDKKYMTNRCCLFIEFNLYNHSP